MGLRYPLSPSTPALTPNWLTSDVQACCAIAILVLFLTWLTSTVWHLIRLLQIKRWWYSKGLDAELIVFSNVRAIWREMRCFTRKQVEMAIKRITPVKSHAIRPLMSPFYVHRRPVVAGGSGADEAGKDNVAITATSVQTARLELTFDALAPCEITVYRHVQQRALDKWMAQQHQLQLLQQQQQQQQKQQQQQSQTDAQRKAVAAMTFHQELQPTEKPIEYPQDVWQLRFEPFEDRPASAMKERKKGKEGITSAKSLFKTKVKEAGPLSESLKMAPLQDNALKFSSRECAAISETFKFETGMHQRLSIPMAALHLSLDQQHLPTFVDFKLKDTQKGLLLCLPKHVVEPKYMAEYLYGYGPLLKLQDIYGGDGSSEEPLSPMAPATASNLEKTSPATAAGAVEDDCAICLTNPRNVCFLPCRHLCVCAECFGEMRKGSGGSAEHCPVCRADWTGCIEMTEGTQAMIH